LKPKAAIVFKTNTIKTKQPTNRKTTKQKPSKLILPISFSKSPQARNESVR